MKLGTARRLASFAGSSSLHAGLLAWLALAPPLDRPAAVRPIYEQEIKPRQNHLVWYHLSNRLPEVKPSAVRHDSNPPRARRKFTQPIVAGPKDDQRPPQLIQVAAPRITLPQPLPLPNLLAGAVLPPKPMPPKPVRTFTPPPKHAKSPAQPLPDAPTVDARPALRNLAMNLPAPKAPALPFTPPPVRLAVPALPVLPAAPPVAISAPTAAGLPRIPKRFVPPPASPAAAPSAPVDLAADAPASAIAAPGQAELAIAGLNPVDTTVIPPIPGSHTAGFSAATRPRTDGAGSRSSDAVLEVPGLLAHDGAPDTRATLVATLASSTVPQSVMDAVRQARQASADRALPEQHAIRAAKAPDPRLEGRLVYTVAIQMPNVTSYSGSWLVWFAERRPEPGTPLSISPPVPIRKVDPKYIQAAAEQKIEGAVRLFAVIRAGGQVDSVELLRHLDPRLDQSAEDALRKWIFEPARRDGAPVDVDAVFEIPFHLAPRLAR